MVHTQTPHNKQDVWQTDFVTPICIIYNTPNRSKRSIIAFYLSSLIVYRELYVTHIEYRYNCGGIYIFIIFFWLKQESDPQCEWYLVIGRIQIFTNHIVITLFIILINVFASTSNVWTRLSGCSSIDRQIINDQVSIVVKRDHHQTTFTVYTNTIHKDNIR